MVAATAVYLFPVIDGLAIVVRQGAINVGSAGQDPRFRGVGPEGVFRRVFF